MFMISMKQFTITLIFPIFNRKAKTKIPITQTAKFFIADMCLLLGNVVILQNKSLSHSLKKLQTKSSKKWKNLRGNSLQKKKRMKKVLVRLRKEQKNNKKPKKMYLKRKL